MGRLDDIQTVLKPLKKTEKIEINFMIILGLAESPKTISPTRLGLAIPPSLMAYFSDRIFLG